MPISMSDLSKPIFERGLAAMSAVLTKGQEHAAARKLDDAVLVQARLFPDMLSLAGQVQRASDTAKGAIARLSGAHNPSFPDEETRFPDLQERIAKTLAYIRSIPAESIDGSETKIVELKAGRLLTFEGRSYLLGFALPNFYFHVTTAYAILRHSGVEIGKLDYMGEVPALSAS